MIKKITTQLLICAILLLTSKAVLAADYKVKYAFKVGKKTKETTATMSIDKSTFSVVPKKAKFKEHSKEFAVSDIKVADYSYSKKPILSTSGAIATAILLGVFVLPLLFIKKKNHWLTVQTEDDFALMRLNRNEFRAVLADLETKGITVNRLTEADRKKGSKNKKKTEEKEEDGSAADQEDADPAK